MNKQINFDPEFSDIITYKMLAHVPDHSEINIHQEINITKFLEIVNKYVTTEVKTLKRTQVTQFVDDKEVKPFYTYVALFGDNIVITYNFNDLDGLNEIDNKDLTDEEIEEIEDVNEEGTTSDTSSDICIYYNSSSIDVVDNIMSEIKDAVYEPKEVSSFYTIGADSYGFRLTKQEANVVDLDVALNYGKDFVSVYDAMLNDLEHKHHGLILMHGEPGTGKTTMIRHMISKLCNHKKIIYVPAYMIEQVANPEFMTFIQKHKESILILEDAEFALQSRSEEYGAQAVSNLLNITNGLLNDVVKIQVIATFNMDKKNIDEALLRPGRLLHEWKFNKLSIDDSKKLAESLNKDFKITEKMTIAEIYAEKVNDKKKKEKRAIGF